VHTRLREPWLDRHVARPLHHAFFDPGPYFVPRYAAGIRIQPSQENESHLGITRFDRSCRFDIFANSLFAQQPGGEQKRHRLPSRRHHGPFVKIYTDAAQFHCLAASDETSMYELFEVVRIEKENMLRLRKRIFIKVTNYCL